MSGSTSESHNFPVTVSAGSPLLSEKLCDELNTFVLKYYETLVNVILSTTPLSDEDFGVLLALIVSRAKHLLQRERLKDFLLDLYIQPDAATHLFEEQPELRDIVRKACEEKSFGHIVDLKFLQKSRSGFLSIRSMQGTDRKNDLLGSFERPYIGKAVDGFFEYLSSNAEKYSRNSDRKYYGKFCSIVQSSGTGKSRLLTELRKRGVITLYMNIRGKNDGGFPNRDEFPSQILTENLTTETEYATCCSAFFAAIFATLEEVLKQKLDSPGGILGWTDDMCNMDPDSTCRALFFTEVESKYPKIYSEMKQCNPVKEGASAESSRPSKKRKSGLDAGDFQQSAPSLDSSADPEGLPPKCAKLLRDAYGHMLNALPTIFTSDHGPKLVIGIDEAHFLSIKNKSFRPSHILCRVITAYSSRGKESVWVAFASTTSRVADFSAPQRIHDSLRVATAGLQLFPPYTYLGWDQNADAVDFPVKEVASFQHIAGFGRPLWTSLMDVVDESLDSVMATVKQKLLGSDKIEPKLALIVLSQRFALDVCFGHPDAVSYVEKGVASHLRICYATLEDRTWSFTGYPSEPLVSCAAAHILHQDTDTLRLALDTLKDKVKDGLFEIGQSGELTSRLVLLLAKDSYVHRNAPKSLYIEIPSNPSSKWSAELIDCQKVPVVEFLESMFGESFWMKAGPAAKTSFRHAYVNFSHWVSMDGLISPKSGDGDRCSPAEWTLRHWHRTSAVQCCHHQPSVDKMIPIFFDDPELKVASDMERMSQMFVSDKAGQKSHEGQELFIKRTDKSIQCQSPRPWIALLLDFNGNGKTKLEVTFEQKPNILQNCYGTLSPNQRNQRLVHVYKHVSDMGRLSTRPTCGGRIRMLSEGCRVNLSQFQFLYSPGRLCQKKCGSSGEQKLTVYGKGCKSMTDL